MTAAFFGYIYLLNRTGLIITSWLICLLFIFISTFKFPKNVKSRHQIIFQCLHVGPRNPSIQCLFQRSLEKRPEKIQWTISLWFLLHCKLHTSKHELLNVWFSGSLWIFSGNLPDCFSPWVIAKTVDSLKFSWSYLSETVSRCQFWP